MDNNFIPELPLELVSNGNSCVDQFDPNYLARGPGSDINGSVESEISFRQQLRHETIKENTNELTESLIVGMNLIPTCVKNKVVHRGSGCIDGMIATNSNTNSVVGVSTGDGLVINKFNGQPGLMMTQPNSPSNPDSISNSSTMGKDNVYKQAEHVRRSGMKSENLQMGNMYFTPSEHNNLFDFEELNQLDGPNIVTDGATYEVQMIGKDVTLSSPCNQSVAPVALSAHQNQNYMTRSVNSTGHIHVDPVKLNLVRSKLIILLHAEECARRSRGTDPNNQPKCNFYYCERMKEVLVHMANCKMSKYCTIKYCSSSRQIITHWRNCESLDCLICSPVRKNNQTICTSHAARSTTDTSPVDLSVILTNEPIPRSALNTPFVSPLNQSTPEPIPPPPNHSISDPMSTSLTTRTSGVKSLSALNLIARSTIKCGSGIFDRPIQSIPIANSLSLSLQKVARNQDKHFYLERPTNLNKELSSEPMIVNYSDNIQPDKEITSSDDIESRTKLVVPQPNEPITSDKTKCLFKPNELCEALMPTFEKMYQKYPESLPFRQPVDALVIPGYYEIIHKPMDLRTIKSKLTSSQYTDPWEYVEDVSLMFDNAKLFNRSTTRVYRYCTIVSEIFDEEINPVMQSLGYCCGRWYIFRSKKLYCYGKQLCIIPRNATYFNYQSYIYCKKCFDGIPGDVVTVNDEQSQCHTQIRKSNFLELKNDNLELEPFVACSDCGRKQHQICVLFLENIWPDGFVCDSCMKKKEAKRKENKFKAKNLPVTNLSIHIETRVNTFLKQKQVDAGEVHIRVLSSFDKMVEVKSEMRNRFVTSGELNGEFSYRSKTLFSFQEIDGVDVCFFGMHVQEYGSECENPNKRRVYIAYLDSVHFFRPRQYRTDVYHEILLGYMDYVKQLGYTIAHIWACPPPEGADYIFHCHPIDQRIPNSKRLQQWYSRMLDKGKNEGIILDYENILQYAMENKLTSAAELPYFEGDFWPNFLEESIKVLDRNQEKQRKQAEAELTTSLYDNNNMKGCSKKKRRKKKSNFSKAAQRKNNKKYIKYQTGNDLSDRILTTMEFHKESFFVIRLHSTQSAVNLTPIQDPDPLMICDLMDGPDAFIAIANDRNFEFSSLRRAKFSTLCMLYQLYNQEDNFAFYCNSCNNRMKAGYHCRVCNDYDLCTSCKGTIGHIHEVDKLEFYLDDSTSLSNLKEANPENANHEHSFVRSIETLVHVYQCSDTNCQLLSCDNMKQVIGHAKSCSGRKNRSCAICRQLIALFCYHAKYCQDAMCPLSFCNFVHREQMQRRLQQAHLMSRRMTIMKTGIMSQVPINCAIGTGPFSASSHFDDLANKSTTNVVEKSDIFFV